MDKKQRIRSLLYEIYPVYFIMYNNTFLTKLSTNYKILRMTHKDIINLLLALFFIITGGLIYICFRSENILFFSWMQYFNINYSILRQANLGNNMIMSYFIYSFPNGLWVLSGLLFLKAFLRNNKKYLIFYSIVFIFISISIEVGQLFGIISGAFDIFDIFTILIFSSIGFFINIKGGKHEKL